MTVPADFPADIGVLSDGSIVYGSNWNLLRDQVLAVESPPMAKYYRNAGVGISNASWQTAFGNVTSSTGVAYDNAAIGAVGSPLTIPTGGVYKLVGSLEFAAASAGTIRSIRFNVNSGAVYLGREDKPPLGSGNSVFVATESVWIFNAGDQIILEAYQDSGGTLNIAPDVSATLPDAGSLAVTWIGLGT